MILDDQYITKDMLTKESYEGNNFAEGNVVKYDLQNGKINVISVVSCYIAIDGTEAYQIHGNSNFRSLCKLLSYIFR